MSARQWLSASAAICQLVLALVALVRGTRPLKLPLVLLCLDVAGWTAASSTYTAFRAPVLSGVDHVLSPLTAIFTMDFVLVFVGLRRSSHVTRLAALILCGSLSIATLIAFQVPGWYPFVGSHLWGTWLMASALPTMAVTLVILVRHRHQTVDPEERARCSLLLVVFVVGTAFAVAEEIGFLDPWVSAADIGMLICGIGMAIVTVRFRLFGGSVPEEKILLLGGPVSLALIVGAVALSRAGVGAVAAFLMTMAVVLVCFALARERLVAGAVRAERTKQLVTLGRLSAQMDHDVRNPLAALKGAAQLLRRDLERETPSLNHLEFAGMVLDQVGRIENILGRYRRLSRVEVDRSETGMNEIVHAVLARQAPALPDGVELRCELATDLPTCSVDTDLVATVLENLVCNAVEAMPKGGTITVRTSMPGPRRVELSVQDVGVGMDARTCERATDDFFTTKATGSGFGLAFTKRVMAAHGGGMLVTSAVGRGTLVRVWIPASGAENSPAPSAAVRALPTGAIDCPLELETR